MVVEVNNDDDRDEVKHLPTIFVSEIPNLTSPFHASVYEQVQQVWVKHAVHIKLPGQ